jgi:hypothetical protein
MTELDVRISALEAHGTRLEAVGERLGEVSRTALTAVALQPVAFGMLCSFLVPVVTAQQSTSLAGFLALGAAVRSEGRAIAATARTYEQADADLSSKISGLTAVEV